MNFKRLLNTYTGKIMISILLGLGLATFFRKMCTGKKCVISKAPPLEEIDDKIYKFDNKCYKLEKNAETCVKDKKTVAFA
jgi:hypothetical protein